MNKNNEMNNKDKRKRIEMRRFWALSIRLSVSPPEEVEEEGHPDEITQLEQTLMVPFCSLNPGRLFLVHI
jgi:hypothetical protein